MMVINPKRGEIAAEFSGKRYRLCLTLGALAELEATYGAEDLGMLLSRIASGKLAARDIARIVGAGLRGGGADVSDADVLAMTVDGGAAGFTDIVARLLKATFGGNEASGSGIDGG